MIDALELEEEEVLVEPIEIGDRGRKPWMAGYPELVRAARAFASSSSFLARHWDELEPSTRHGLLRSIEATAYDVTRLLGARHEDSGFDDALAARVASL